MGGRKGQTAWNKGLSVYPIQYSNRIEYTKEWRKLNLEKYNAQKTRQNIAQIKKRRSNPQPFRENDKHYYQKRKHRISESGKKYLKKIRLELMNVLGGAYCKQCGYNIMEALQFDHINGGGTKERKLFYSNKGMYLFYIDNNELAKKKLQVLCANCNFIKHMRGERS